MNAPLHLPPIPLRSLSERAKDYILAYCNQHHCTPEEAMRQILVTSARGAGFFDDSTEGAKRELVMGA